VLQQLDGRQKDILDPPAAFDERVKISAFLAKKIQPVNISVLTVRRAG
jgi:hypothetical protein